MTAAIVDKGNILVYTLPLRGYALSNQINYTFPPLENRGLYDRQERSSSSAHQTPSSNSCGGVLRTLPYTSGGKTGVVRSGLLLVSLVLDVPPQCSATSIEKRLSHDSRVEYLLLALDVALGTRKFADALCSLCCVHTQPDTTYSWCHPEWSVNAHNY